MENQPSRDELHRSELRAELVRRGLPRAYIERLLAELDDHFTDLIEERSSTMGAARKLSIQSDDVRQRLGEPAQLAIFAAEQYHARSFLGRHPLVTFVLGPLPMLVVFWIATALGVTWTGMGIAYICEHWFGLRVVMQRPQDHLLLQAIVISAISWFAIVFPPLAVAILLCRVARRNAVSWRWPIVGCTLLAIVAGFLSVWYRLAIAPNDGQWVVGVDFDYSVRWILLTYLPKFAVALGIGLLLVKRVMQQREAEFETKSNIASG